MIGKYKSQCRPQRKLEDRQKYVNTQIEKDIVYFRKFDNKEYTQYKQTRDEIQKIMKI